MKYGKSIIGLFIGFIYLFGMVHLCNGDVKPGDVIGPKNWEKAKGLIQPAVLNEIKNGYQVKVREFKPHNNPREYDEATKKYAGGVKIGPDGELINYIAGLPFPEIDTSDPQAGLKAIWNYYFRWRGDDYLFGGSAGGRSVGPMSRHCINKYGNEILNDVGQIYLKPHARVTLDPKPKIPGFENIDEFYISIVQSPRDQAGITTLQKRYFDPLKEDDLWIYIPSLRRVRRLPTTQRCATKAPSDYTADDVWGFQGKVTLFNYKLLAPVKLLIVNHQKHVPMKNKKGFWLPLDEEVELVDVYDIEQTPKDPAYCYSKKILRVSKNTFSCAGIFGYDKKGELWKEFWTSHRVLTTRDGQKTWNFGFNASIDVQVPHYTTTDSFDYPVNVGISPEDYSLRKITTVSRMGGF